VGIESTIVDCTRGAPVLLRPGQITPSQIELTCGQALATAGQIGQAAPRASGTLESHYAPRARVRLLSAATLPQQLCTLADPARPAGGAIGLWSPKEPQTPHPGLIWRRQSRDPAAAAQQLFAVLRELDALGVVEIWVEQVPEGAAWDGVRDRLQRAAA
jgi:L-threonylcarbamoyladenylate synthase